MNLITIIIIILIAITTDLSTGLLAGIFIQLTGILIEIQVLTEEVHNKL